MKKIRKIRILDLWRRSVAAAIDRATDRRNDRTV